MRPTTMHSTHGRSFLTQIASMSAGYVCLHACLAGVRLAAPLLALRTGYSEVAVGFLMALFSLSQVLLALPAARFADRHGFRRPMTGAIIVCAAGTAVSGALPVFPVLCVTAMLAGGSSGCAMIAMQRHMGRIAQDPAQLRIAFSWLAVAPAFAGFVGPTLAGTVIDLAGFRVAFLAIALLPFAGWFWIRTLPEEGAVCQTQRVESQSAWDLCRDLSFRRIVELSVLLQTCWDVLNFVLPIIGNERGYPASVVGMMLGAAAISAAAVRVALPKVAPHWPEWKLVSGAMAMTSLLLCIYPLLSAVSAMATCSVLLGAALGSVQPMVMSTLHQVIPQERQGDAIALRWMAVNLSSVAMPMVIGVAGAFVGVKSVLWIVGIGAGCGARVAVRLRDVLADAGETSTENALH